MDNTEGACDILITVCRFTCLLDDGRHRTLRAHITSPFAYKISNEVHKQLMQFLISDCERKKKSKRSF